MDHKEAVNAIEARGELTIADIPASTKLAIGGAADVEAEKILFEEYADPILRIYEVQGDNETVGKILSEADVPKLPRVIDIVDDDDIPLDAADCRAAQDAYEQ